MVPKRDRPGARCARYLRRLISRGFRALAARAGAPMAARGRCPLPPLSSRPLVVLVHGYEGSPGEFAFLVETLRATIGATFDFALVDTLDPSMGEGPEENVARLDAFLRGHGLHERPLYLIGHSLGGVIARAYSRRADAPAPRALVLIGTPNGGINAWNLLPIHWMRSAGFRARINQRYPARAGVAHLLIVGTRGRNLLEGWPNDRVVGRWSVKALLAYNDAGAPMRVSAYPLDHWGLLTDAAVAREIAGFLAAVHAGGG